MCYINWNIVVRSPTIFVFVVDICTYFCWICVHYGSTESQPIGHLPSQNFLWLVFGIESFGCILIGQQIVFFIFSHRRCQFLFSYFCHTHKYRNDVSPVSLLLFLSISQNHSCSLSVFLFAHNYNVSDLIFLCLLFCFDEFDWGRVSLTVTQIGFVCRSLFQLNFFAATKFIFNHGWTVCDSRFAIRDSRWQCLSFSSIYNWKT